MNIPSRPRDYEVLAARAGVSLAEACRRAKVHPAVMAHWRADRHVPSIDKVEKVYRVLMRLIEIEERPSRLSKGIR